jgi:uncharacterized repeat protein (TIGR03803 family)
MNPKANSIQTRRLWGLAAAGFFAAGVTIGQTFQIVHELTAAEGADPHAGITQTSDGFFVGTTVENYGTIFRMDASGSFWTIHTFNGLDDGSKPHGALLQAHDALRSDGALYGTTASGMLGGGTVFKLDPTGAPFTTCKVFNPSAGGANGEGGSPQAPLIQASDGNFYGTTVMGGHDGLGTIFRMDAACNVTTLHHFSGDDGAYPYEYLLEVEGKLYGTTSSGGPMRKGTVFRIDMASLRSDYNFAVLHNFLGPDGANPESALVNADGYLFGTTVRGGNNAGGVIYRMNPPGTMFTVIHHFGAGSDGVNPHATLLQARDRHLYGTTSSGSEGKEDPYGAIFRMHTFGGGFEIVHRFRGTDGAFPQSRMIEATDGSLYGTTAQGGKEKGGVVYKLMFVQVDGIRPTSGRASGVAVAISGANFLPGVDVTVGGLDALNVLLSTDSTILATTPALEPGTLNNIVVDNPDSTRGAILRGFFADFLDVPQADIFHGYVEKIFRNGITAGIGGGKYGRDASASRAQMAVFLLKAMHGRFFVPPPATGTVFADVSADNPYAPWIERLHAEGISAGCDAGSLYCPYDPMTREQMAVSLLRAKYGSGYVPPPCRGIFGDVPCSSVYAPWIEQLAVEHITGGCGNGNFCPGDPSTRGQVAVFLTKTFGLQ